MMKVFTYGTFFLLAFMVVGWPIVFIAGGCFLVGVGRALANRSGG